VDVCFNVCICLRVSVCVCVSLYVSLFVFFVVCGLWCVDCGVWIVVCGLWCVVCGVWFVVCGLWCVYCGVWTVVCHVWCGVCGACRVVFSVLCVVLVPRSQNSHIRWSQIFAKNREGYVWRNSEMWCESCGCVYIYAIREILLHDSCWVPEVLVRPRWRRSYANKSH